MTDAATDRPELDLSGWARPFVVVAALVAAMWAVELVDLLPGTRFDTWGIRPRQAEGLVGVGAAPFLHDGLPHLVGNTIPFLVLGGAIAASGIVRWAQVTLLVAAVCGVGTWLVGPAGTTHIGASGIVFGYLTYLLARGLFERRATYLVVGALALFLYGGVLWGLLPRPGVSWQGHAFGALGGVLAARLLHAGGARRVEGRPTAP